MSGQRWLILADDLTGAADCAIAFAKRGLATSVGWGDPTGVPDGESSGAAREAYAHDTNSRALPAAEAAERQRAAFARFHRPGCLLYKKIDSTMRGQPAAEIAALAAALAQRDRPAFGIFAPAFPATGRTTRGGRVLVAGAPLEEAEVWRREHTYPDADLQAILAGAGLGGSVIPLAAVRADENSLRAALRAAAARGGTVAVCDAETEDDLRRIAEASLPAMANVTTFFAGSAGLAAALAAVVPAGSDDRPGLSPASGGTLVIVGSLAAASRAAAGRLATEPDVVYRPVQPGILLDPAGAAARDALAEDVGNQLRAKKTVLVELLLEDALNVAIDSRLVAALAAALEPVAPYIGNLAATGGETAASLLSRFGVHGIRLLEEVEPGIALGLTLGRHAFPVATKAGAFGGPESLLRIVRHVERLR